MIKKVLTIAGSDCSGGAGIQADIKTINTNKCYAMSVITAITAQNTLGVQAIKAIDNKMIAMQMDSIFKDIFPDAIKIGMMGNLKNVEMITSKLRTYKAYNIVLDPVMVSSTGAPLLELQDIGAIINLLFPLATVITPNIPEAEIISKQKIKGIEDMQDAAIKIYKRFKVPVLIKGGHSSTCADDVLVHLNEIVWFKSKKIKNPNNHGTGCTLSSAIACNLALGHNLVDSIKLAKAYVTKLLTTKEKIGNGIGPLIHFYDTDKKE